MTGYLLDTNVISEVRKPKPHGAVLEWIASVGPDGLFVPSIVLFELQAGVELTRWQNPEKAQEIELWIDSLCRLDKILPLDARSFRLCAKLVDGRSLDLLADAMVASIAMVHGLTVATRNIGDYSPFDVPVVNPFSVHR
jgi:predicted nucleic acid-binding protein